MTEHTITNREHLDAEFREIRNDGYAIDDEECLHWSADCCAAGNRPRTYRPRRADGIRSEASDRGRAVSRRITPTPSEDR